MSLKQLAAKLFAKYIYQKEQQWINNPHQTQDNVFKKLIINAQNTTFGKDHNFKNINTHQEFTKQVPIRDYEGLKPYIEQVINGKQNILWPGKPIYFAKTSGTTSGAKYIPITKASIPSHIKSARNALLFYIYNTNNADFVNGKMIFLQGSPKLDEQNGIKIGRLSGISAHYVPNYLLKNRLPSWETNIIEDWETKVDKIITETLPEDMTVISGIPSWVQMYFEKLQEKTGKKIKDLFPNFNFFIYGGVNFEPYKARFEHLIGKPIDYIELFPASEGFFAYQDTLDQEGMLLLLDNGIFYEFIPLDQYFTDNPTRLPLKDVQLGVNYALIINSNAGLWGYSIGDTIVFTSLKPYRVKVSGRIKHFISAFGEHVIAKELETALKEAMTDTNILISEFTVAPQVNPTEGLPYHQWFIEFEQQPDNLDTFAQQIDLALQQQNIYYKDLIEGGILRTLVITAVKKGTFHQYMKSIGKFGGQNKIPQLSDDRKIADALFDMDLLL